MQNNNYTRDQCYNCHNFVVLLIASDVCLIIEGFFLFQYYVVVEFVIKPTISHAHEHMREFWLNVHAVKQFNCFASLFFPFYYHSLAVLSLFFYSFKWIFCFFFVSGYFHVIWVFTVIQTYREQTTCRKTKRNFLIHLVICRCMYCNEWQKPKTVFIINMNIEQTPVQL